MGVQDLWQSLRGHQPRVELPVSMRCDPPRTDDITFQVEFDAAGAPSNRFRGDVCPFSSPHALLASLHARGENLNQAFSNWRSVQTRQLTKATLAPLDLAPAVTNYAEINNSGVVSCLSATNPMQDGRGKH